MMNPQRPGAPGLEIQRGDAGAIGRRGFISSAALCFASFGLGHPFRDGVATLGRLLPESVLRIGIDVDATRTDLLDGVRFGIAEADRSARLFGWRVERADALSTAHALVLGGDGPAPRADLPVVRVDCSTRHHHDDSFVIAPCERKLAWRPSLERYGAAQLNDRYRAAIGRGMSSDAWLGWFAVKILAEPVLRLKSTDGAALRAYLRAPATRFDGHKGEPLRFDASRVLIQPLYDSEPSR